MGYLAINMSGQIMNVYTAVNGKDVQIGRIYHKERFSYLGKISYNGSTEIKFLNSSGQYVNGYCWPGANQANDWINYAFRHGFWPYIGFKTDAPVNLYGAGGTTDFRQTIPSGSFVVPCNNGYTEIGSTNNDWMRIREVVLPSGDLLSIDYGLFADCGIRRNSTNTPVYGNWN